MVVRTRGDGDHPLYTVAGVCIIINVAPVNCKSLLRRRPLPPRRPPRGGRPPPPPPNTTTALLYLLLYPAKAGCVASC